MQQYNFGNAIVRIHGSYEPDKLEEATKKYVKKVMKCKKQRKQKESCTS
jgi:hypothetical protein